MAGWGGKRPGAGRKPGSPTKRRREIIDKAADEGLTPVEYMLREMRDTANPKALRLEVAKAVAPYVSPRMSSVEITKSLRSMGVRAASWSYATSAD